MTDAVFTSDESTVRDLVKSISIDNMVNQRAAVLAKVERAVQLLLEAAELATAAHIGFPRFKTETNRYALNTMLDPDRIGETYAHIRQEIDRTAWHYLLNESGLRSFMDAKAREEWDKGLENTVPELTAANVAATFQSMHAARGDLFDRGVIECFRALSWNYKTNLPQKFGKRIVIRFLRGQVSGGGKRLSYIDHHRADRLDDLERVFSVLDGKPEADHRNGWYFRLNGVSKTTDPHAESDYMQVKSFLNGNGHVTFKRLDLVDKMNLILHRHFPNAIPAEIR